jgi:hypothetical protein
MTEQATCPTCDSPSIQAVPIEKKKIADAIVAEYFLGTAAGVAAGSAVVIQAICLKCGQQWFPGTNQEEQLRILSGQRGPAAQRDAQERLAATARVQQDLDQRSNRVAVGVLVIVVMILAGILVTQGIEQQQEAARSREAIRIRDSVHVQDSLHAARRAQSRVNTLGPRKR